MSTTIKCEIDGISKPLELQGGLSFGYSSSANVSNASNDKKITFGPVEVSSFSFSIMEPDKDAVKSLIQWLVSHQVKNKVTFKISDQEMEAKSRDLVLEKVCLESYNESVSEYGSQISLSMVGQKVVIDGVTVDQTTQR
jgi:hypothetical protein